MDLESVKALTFDVFGTVVDWRTSVIREIQALGRGDLPWARLDDLHRMSLERVVTEFGIQGLGENDIDHLNRAWHRLDPWPEAVAGLTRLRRRFVLATLSNGNVALTVNMARYAGQPWDAVLGAEVARCYKPLPQAYLVTADLLGLRPEQCMMVAAHNGDLVASGALGFRTAFVYRRTEHGPDQTTDLAPERDYDVVAEDFLDLATRLGC